MKKLAVIILFLTLVSVGYCNQKMHPHDCGQLRLAAEAVTTIVTANEYVLVSGNFTDGNIHDFSLASNGTLSYRGYCTHALLNGVSDISVDKACEITYGLFKNGQLVAEAQTPHTFTSAAKTETIAITSIISLTNGDQYYVGCKSSEANTELTVRTLAVTLWAR